MPPVTSAAFVARGPEAREEAILWAKRYGKNCMDAHSPSVGKALRQTTNRQRPAAETQVTGRMCSRAEKTCSANSAQCLMV